MEQGAFGVSSGLDYPPGAYATTDELAELANEAATLGGMYHTHVRYSLGDRFLDPFREAIEIGRRGEAPAHITHFYHRQTFPGTPDQMLDARRRRDGRLGLRPAGKRCRARRGTRGRRGTRRRNRGGGGFGLVNRLGRLRRLGRFCRNGRHSGLGGSAGTFLGGLGGFLAGRGWGLGCRSLAVGVYGSACTLGGGCLGFGFVGSCCCQCFVGFLTVCHR